MKISITGSAASACGFRLYGRGKKIYLSCELKDTAVAIVALGDESLAMSGLRSLLRRGERHNGEKISLKEAAKAASREAEKELILRVLTRTRWNRRRAAEELQISYKALLYKLKQIGYQEYGA